MLVFSDGSGAVEDPVMVAAAKAIAKYEAEQLQDKEKEA